MGFSEGKCSVLQLGQNNPIQPYRLDNGGSVAEKDLKVPVGKKVKRRQQCVFVTNKANSILYHNSKVVAMCTRAAIIPTTSGVLSPVWGFLAQSGCWHTGTRLPRWPLEHLTYEQRLREVGIFSLKKRRCRGDLSGTCGN